MKFVTHQLAFRGSVVDAYAVQALRHDITRSPNIQCERNTS